MYLKTQLHFHMNTQTMVIRFIDFFHSWCPFRFLCAFGQRLVWVGKYWNLQKKRGESLPKHAFVHFKRLKITQSDFNKIFSVIQGRSQRKLLLPLNSTFPRFFKLFSSFEKQNYTKKSWIFSKTNGILSKNKRIYKKNAKLWLKMHKKKTELENGAQ